MLIPTFFSPIRCLLINKGDKDYKSPIENDGEVAFAVGIWFALNNPSIYHNMKTVVETTNENYAWDTYTYRTGFALTNLAINGDLECGDCSPMKEHSKHRVDYFTTFCEKFDLKSWTWYTDAKSSSDDEKKGAYCSYMTKDWGGDELTYAC